MLQEELVGNFSEGYSAREKLKNDLCTQSDSAWSKVSDYVHEKTRGISTRHSRVIRIRAEEIAQNVLLSIYTSIRTYDPKRNIEPWIQTIIHNRIRDELRNIGRRTKPWTLEEKYGDGSWDGNEMVTCRMSNTTDYREREEEGKRYMRSNRLDKSQRELLEDLYGRSITWKTAAEQLGIPLGTLKSRIGRSLKVLRELARETNVA